MYRGNATRDVCVGDIYIPAAIFPFYIYNKVYLLTGDICVYVYVGECHAVVYIDIHSAWAGFTLLILT